MKSLSSNGKKFAVGGYVTRERDSRRQLLLIEFFQFLDLAKGNPVKDRLIHPHLQMKSKASPLVSLLSLKT
jgi:hypothetical protein